MPTWSDIARRLGELLVSDSTDAMSMLNSFGPAALTASSLAFVGYAAVHHYVLQPRRLLTQSPPRPLSEPAERALAAGAFYSLLERTQCRTLETGLTPAEAQKVLRERWGVSNSKAVVEALASLHERGRKSIYASIRAAIVSVGYERSIDALLEERPEAIEPARRVLRFFTVHHISPTDTPHSIAAWDYGRLMMLARLCFDAGYIDSPTAWQWVDFAAEQIYRHHRSWHDVAIATELGLRTFAHEDSKRSDIGIAKSLLARHAQSPWMQFPWGALEH